MRILVPRGENPCVSSCAPLCKPWCKPSCEQLVRVPLQELCDPPVQETVQVLVRVFVSSCTRPAARPVRGVMPALV